MAIRKQTALSHLATLLARLQGADGVDAREDTEDNMGELEADVGKDIWQLR